MWCVRELRPKNAGANDNLVGFVATIRAEQRRSRSSKRGKPGRPPRARETHSGRYAQERPPHGAMKFRGEIEATKEKVADERMRSTLLGYKQLKKDVKSIAAQLRASGRHERLCEGDCAVCLDPLGREVDVVTTSCGHQFHPICVAEALIVGRDHSCPLCRRKVDLAMPGGVDGEILRFLARLRMSAHEMAACHSQVLSEISVHCARLPQRPAPLDAPSHSGCTPHFFSAYHQRGKEHKRKVAVANVQRRVSESALWALTNLHGLRKILKKLDKRTGMTLRGEFMRQLVLGKSFVQDFIPETGKYSEILRSVTETEGDEGWGEIQEMVERVSSAVEGLRGEEELQPAAALPGEDTPVTPDTDVDEGERGGALEVDADANHDVLAASAFDVDTGQRGGLVAA